MPKEKHRLGVRSKRLGRPRQRDRALHRERGRAPAATGQPRLSAGPLRSQVSDVARRAGQTLRLGTATGLVLSDVARGVAGGNGFSRTLCFLIRREAHNAAFGRLLIPSVEDAGHVGDNGSTAYYASPPQGGSMTPGSAAFSSLRRGGTHSATRPRGGQSQRARLRSMLPHPQRGAQRLARPPCHPLGGGTHSAMDRPGSPP
jgi:hypothetical protein